MRTVRAEILAMALSLVLLIPALPAAQEKQPGAPQLPRSTPYVEIYVELSRAFENDLKRGDLITTDISEEYLHQIAVSARYDVETNLQMLKQQARIIDLLEQILSSGAADGKTR